MVLSSSVSLVELVEQTLLVQGCDRYKKGCDCAGCMRREEEARALLKMAERIASRVKE